MNEPCCAEYRCKRSKRILIRQGGLTERWYAVTDWKPLDGGFIEAMQKHDVTDELVAALVAAGWTPPDQGTYLAEQGGNAT